MNEKIVISSSNSSKLSKISQDTIRRLIQSKIIDIRGFDSITLPASMTEIYIYLKNQMELKEKGKMKQQEVLRVVEQIMISQKMISCGEPVSENINSSFQLLSDQIIEAICQLQQNILDRFQIDGLLRRQSIKQNRQQTGKVMVSLKNGFGIGNLVKICTYFVSSIHLMKSNRLKIQNLLQYYVFKIYIQPNQNVPSIVYQKIVQSLKQYIKNAVQLKHNVQPYLSALFFKNYQLFWSKQKLDFNNIQMISLLERHLTLLEFIHYNIPYHQHLIKSQLFKQHIKSLFLFRGQNKASIHLLAINIFEKLAKNKNQYLAITQVFINLFNIMSSYGVHLIKDVWSSFYLLVESTQKSLFQPIQLIEIILWKLENHQNSNVIKYCLHEVLQNANSNRLFQKIPSIIYKSLIRMLNLGVNYLDCLFHMDSKAYNIIVSFFMRFYGNTSLCQLKLKNHLECLLKSIYDLQNYDHALIALLMIFKDLSRNTNFLNISWMSNLVKLVTTAYVRYPIRKRYQMMDSILSLLLHHLDCESVGIQTIFQLFIQVNSQYLIEPNLSKLRQIMHKYGQEQVKRWMNLMAEDIIFQVKTNIIFEQSKYDWNPLLIKIKIVQFYLTVSDLTFQFYQQFFRDMIAEYGESLYKSYRQRCFLITAYYYMFSNLIQSMKESKMFTDHLQASLNLFAIFNEKEVMEDQKDHMQSENLSKKIVEMVQKLFKRSYAYNQGEQFSDREGERVVLARMMEWAFDHIHLNIGIQIVFAALRARIVVNRQRLNRRDLYHKYQNLFEQTLYQMYDEINATENISNKKISGLLKDKQLRLNVLLTTILITDSRLTLAKELPNCNEIGDVVDRYDFQRYEEVCWYVQSIYCNSQRQNILKLLDEQQLKFLVKQLDLLLENMVHNLGYSLQKKQILPLCQTVVRILFRVINIGRRVSGCLVEMVIRLIKVGQSYLIFERAVVMCVVDGILQNMESLKQFQCDGLIPLFVAILSIEEYRGFDSAVYCYKENMSMQVYRQFDMELQRNYYGTLPRFIFIFFLRECFGMKKTNRLSSKFVGIIVNACVDIALAPVAKQKMFLSGKNKIKLQIWQFLLLFDPMVLYQSMQVRMDQFLLRCIQSIGQNSISEIRYYSQLFILRILLNPNLFKCISSKILDSIQIGLANSIGNVSKNVAYMVNSGLIIRHVSSMAQKDYQHFIHIKDSFINLYNTLLTYICSSVAYFRGLSQYFCLEDIKGCLETKYVSILRQNYLMDPDAITLKSRLNSIIENLVKEIESWDIKVQILSQIPNQNNNVVCRHYYMQILKKMSLQLASITKNDDGFTAYRNIWKKNVALSLSGKNQVENDLENEAEIVQNGEETNEDKEGAFQRKIDPTWDFIYNKDTGSHLKILVNSKSQVLMGHLARTGQIFGIQELIIPNLKMLALQSFKSISVTAERWLKISELGNCDDSKSNGERLTRVLIKHRSEGYKIVKLSKGGEKDGQGSIVDLKGSKCLLVIDQENELSSDNYGQLDGEITIGKNLSLHVEASIFIWCYFKRYMKKE